jgi:hypothetical protein
MSIADVQESEGQGFKVSEFQGFQSLMGRVVVAHSSPAVGLEWVVFVE